MSEKEPLLMKLRNNKIKIWKIFRVVYWTIILIAAIASEYLLYTELLS
ncbi:hypothetical protein DSAG12_04490 [Promethearchaeum syntrophicum]|uniref:Uncharacterized protein n=1 Tax=Promethearchaeum syntrophicum TaxID=2594042 RepID=A0AC61ZU36_9ARCH|nr:hypothetical protein [Candidatus Prometheoarchaeum syntrophicum]